LLENFPDFKQDKIAIATFGPTTAKAVRDAGLRLDLEAPTQQYPSITSAIDAFIAKENKA
jgi:uroporphyrinogen-III synthase